MFHTVNYKRDNLPVLDNGGSKQKLCFTVRSENLESSLIYEACYSNHYFRFTIKILWASRDRKSEVLLHMQVFDHTVQKIIFLTENKLVDLFGRSAH